MPYTTKLLDKSQIEFTVTVLPEKYQTNLTASAERLSRRSAIKGFRQGHVPFETMRTHVGDMAILQEALESIIQSSFYEAVREEKVETIGMPKIELDKVAPGNELVYRATVALLPKVALPALDTISITQKPAAVDDKKVDETLHALRGYQANEVSKSGPATGTDKLVLDMNMTINNVPVEGGQAKNYQVYLSEDHYIPGFNEHVAGLQKGDEKKFSLSFPKEHYQSHLAGKLVNFKVKVNDVFERQLPELTDELAKKLRQESITALTELIRNNLLEEAKKKSAERTEIEMLDKLIAGAAFDPIPEVIIASEKQKMFYELKRDLERHHVTIEQYLQDIKKKEDELLADFTAQAEKRAKAALISRQVAKEQGISISKEDIDAEIAMMEGAYKDNTETLEALKRPEVRDTIGVTLQNRKVMEWLKEKILKA